MDVVSGRGRRRGHAMVLAGVLSVIGLVASPASALAVGPAPQPDQDVVDPRWTGPGFNVHRESRNNVEHADVNVCSTAIGPGYAHCDARFRTDSTAKNLKPARAGGHAPQADDLVGNNGGYDPGYLQSAYNVASAIAGGAGKGQVVAIVDAFDSPTAESDLANYRAWFGLPPVPSCAHWPSPTACFSKVNQNGGTAPPQSADAGWAMEIALDLDMVSAMCPSCTILLVEANSNTFSDLNSAVSRAVASGANVVSNSYGAGEFPGEQTLDGVFDHPGVAFTVSSGDGGYGVEWPAASPFVTAVGGTTLNQTTNVGVRSATETAWSGAGSGCSLYEGKPSWQTDTACGQRTVTDVSAVADPGTGVWVYNTFQGSGWGILGGTSAAAPIVGAVYALAGNSLSSTQRLSSDPYGHLASLFDISGGSNGTCGTYLCTGVLGYDGPTGLGTPNGVAAFANPVLDLDFALSIGAPTLVVKHGKTISETLTLAAINGYHSAVQMSVSGLPPNVSASFGPAMVTPSGSTTLTVRTTAKAGVGTYPLTITARGADGTTHTATVSVVVQ